ncbi:MAG: hypothetical protein ACTHK8_08410 [Ginsengibacter sp.]
MKLFKKHREPFASPAKDKVAKGITGFIVKVNSGFASYMNKITVKLSSSTLKVFVIVFLSFGTSLSFYFIVAAFIKDEPSKTIKIDRVSVPGYYDQSGSGRVKNDFVITKEEYEEMKRYSKYFDSLRGSKEYDSIKMARPGLMDSLKLLEKIYKNKN